MRSQAESLVQSLRNSFEIEILKLPHHIREMKFELQGTSAAFQTANSKSSVALSEPSMLLHASNPALERLRVLQERVDRMLAV